MEPEKPLLVFDGECPFCRRWIARWQCATGERVDYAPYQEVAARFPEIPPEQFKEAVHLLEPAGPGLGRPVLGVSGRPDDGRTWTRRAEAVFRLVSYAGEPRGSASLQEGEARRGAPGAGWLLALYRDLPGFAPASEWVYRVVAHHRPFFDRLTDWIWGEHVVPPGERRTSWIFVRALGAITAIAFLSLWVQVLGLVGHNGILPAREYLTDVAGRFGPIRFWFLPTLFWLGSSDGLLVAACALGTVLSLLLMVGIAPILCLAGTWALYLSLATACREFLWFQWDGLLLETLFLSMFLAPPRWWSRPATDPPPMRVGIWLLRWLLFRLMISSAAVKLSSGDPTWRNLTALQYHYETQCIPPWTAWYAHHLPAGVQKASALAMFVIEGFAPFFIVTPRRIRFAAAGALAGLQLVIALTGNYGFFNLLAVALCILLLDDGIWPRRGRSRAPRAAEPSATPGPCEGPGQFRRSSPFVRIVAVVIVVTSLVPTLRALNRSLGELGPLTSFYRFVSPWRTINAYGLFSIMTTSRPEIIVEGSVDGMTWLPYEFPYKPGDPMRRPRFVAPHQPRLDWQMWFAALSDYRNEPWFLSFCERLLQGAEPVLGLMKKNPFPERPPRYLRTVTYLYHFTTPAERRATGAWWRREPRGLYCPVLTLENGRLVAVGPQP